MWIRLTTGKGEQEIALEKFHEGVDLEDALERTNRAICQSPDETWALLEAISCRLEGSEPDRLSVQIAKLAHERILEALLLCREGDPVEIVEVQLVDLGGE